MITLVSHYDCELINSGEKLEKRKLYKHIYLPSKSDIKFTIEKNKMFNELYIGFINLNTCADSERTLVFDMTTENNRQLTLLKRFMNKLYLNPGVSLELEIIRYWKPTWDDSEHTTVGYSIRVNVRDAYTKELRDGSVYFSFWNTRTNQFFTDIALVEMIDDNPESKNPSTTTTKYPKNVTIKQWSRRLTTDINMYNSIGEIIFKFLRILNVQTKYPIELKAAIVEFFKQELKYAYMLTYEKWVTTRTKLDYEEVNKSLIVVMYKLLHNYEPKDNFSYAMFYSKVVLDNIRTIDLFRILYTDDFNYFFSLSEQYNTANIKYHMQNEKLTKLETDIMWCLIRSLTTYYLLSFQDKTVKPFTCIEKELKLFLRLEKKLDLKNKSKRYKPYIYNLIDSVLRKYKTKRFHESIVDMDELIAKLRGTYPAKNRYNATELRM